MELWDLYDENGNKTGETFAREMEKEHGLPKGRFHIVCDILVRHDDGTFLLMKRDERKDVYPGYWEASAGGSALAGETPLMCAKRELFEETGIGLSFCQLFLSCVVFFLAIFHFSFSSG